MGEHLVAGHVADGVVARHGGLELLVDLHEAAFALGDAHRFEADLLHVGRAAGGHEHLLHGDLLRGALRLHGQARAGLGDLHVADLGAGHHVDLALLEGAREFGAAVGVFERQHGGRHFDERHLGAEAREHVGELAAHRAGADDGHGGGRLFGHQHVVAREHHLLVEFEADLRQPLHARAGGDDHGLLGVVRVLLAVGTGDGDLLALLEHAFAADPLHLVLLEQELHALGVLLAHGARALHGGAEVERHAIDGDAMIGGLADLLRQAGAFEQGFGGDAPPEHAGATQRFALDDGDLHAQLGATNGTHVTGGAAAEDDDVERSHGEFG